MRTLLLALLFSVSCGIAPDPHDAIYRLEITTPDGGHGVGTSFAIGSNLLLTAAHICSASNEGAVLSIEGRELEVVKFDEEVDLCLLKSEVRLPKYLRISRNDPARTDKVTIIGFPLGMPIQVVTRGEVAGNILGSGDHIRVLYSCPIFRGNSGGPILNEDGDVIGVAIEVMQSYSQLSVGVTLDEIWEFLVTPEPEPVCGGC